MGFFPHPQKKKKKKSKSRKIKKKKAKTSNGIRCNSLIYMYFSYFNFFFNSPSKQKIFARFFLHFSGSRSPPQSNFEKNKQVKYIFVVLLIFCILEEYKGCRNSMMYKTIGESIDRMWVVSCHFYLKINRSKNMAKCK